MALPHGIKVTHVGVKPKKLPDGRVVPERVFGFEVTGAYPVKEVWGAVMWMDVNGNIARRGLPARRAYGSQWGRKIGRSVQTVFKRLQFQVTGKRLLPGQLLFTPKGIISLLGLQILGRGLTVKRRGEDQAECPNGDRP